MRQKGHKEDIDLVNQVRAGDQTAFKAIVLKYEKTLATVVKGMLGNKPDADDIGQETFIRFYNSIGQYKGDASLGTYLTRIGINLSLNEIKKRKRKAWVDMNEQLDTNYSDDGNFNRTDEQEIIQKALNNLSIEFRSVILLRIVEGYSSKETAQILSLPLGTVLSRLSRGQQKLREILLKMDVDYK